MHFVYEKSKLLFQKKLNYFFLNSEFIKNKPGISKTLSQKQQHKQTQHPLRPRTTTPSMRHNLIT